MGGGGGGGGGRGGGMGSETKTGCTFAHKFCRDLVKFLYAVLTVGQMKLVAVFDPCE